MMIEVREIAVPATWDGDDEAAAMFRAMVDVRNAVHRHRWDGDTQHDITYQEAFGTAINQVDERIVYLGGWLGGALVARGFLELPKAEALHVGYVDVLVAPNARRHGVGTAVWKELERLLTEAGRTTVQAWIDHPPAEGPVLSPPTQAGVIPAENAEVRFLTKFGFELQQIERMSSLNVADSADQLEALLADAGAASPDYELLTWIGPTPPELAPGLADLHARMATDAPAAGLDIDEERWDAERLARYEQMEADRSRTILRAIARHRETGAIVAFTTLVVAADPSRPAYQHDTLVHGDHRGHRLGMLVKVANLEQLRERFSATPVVLTWNAEENRPMLDVNEAIGFVAIGYEGAWQRKDAAT